jgi:heme-degrading monooxygenase HmoA
MSTSSSRTHAPAARTGSEQGSGPISRVWRGWTTHAHAAAYQELVAGTVLPGQERLAGYRGAHLLRREVEEEVEFLVITRWESFEAVREFAGEDYETATIPRAAERLLERFDARALHYRQLYGLAVEDRR